MSKRIRKNRQKGFSLIELLIVVVVLGIVGVFIAAMMSSRARTIEFLGDNKNSSDSLESALKTLSQLPYERLADGGSFTPVDEGSVSLEPCSPETCDFVTDVIPSNPSPAGGTMWSAGGDAPVLFLRRWRIEEVSPELRLKKITAAVFSDEQSSHPLTMTQTIVGDK